MALPQGNCRYPPMPDPFVGILPMCVTESTLLPEPVMNEFFFFLRKMITEMSLTHPVTLKIGDSKGQPGVGVSEVVERALA